MGFRFSIDDANTVALSTCGRVIPCYDSIFYSHDNYNGFCGFLDRFRDNYYSGDYEKINKYSEEIRGIQEVLAGCDFEKNMNALKQSSFEATGEIYRDEKVLRSLHTLSGLFDNYRIKSLLLPQVNNEYGEATEHFMSDEKTLRELLRRYPYAQKDDSPHLILQLADLPVIEGLTVFNAFPRFGVALRQAKKWPAVLFWDGKNRENFSFVPVSNREELDELYGTVLNDQNYFRELDRRARPKEKRNQYYIHLSDLHFGSKAARDNSERLKQLIEEELSTMKSDDVGFIVSGDSTDSPFRGGRESDSFMKFLESKSSREEIISVVGNHDIGFLGQNFLLYPLRQLFARFFGRYPTIKSDDRTKVLFLLFDSCNCPKGMFASGKIGEKQMLDMSDKLAKLREKKKSGDYLYIAVLHHHVVRFQKPDFYRKGLIDNKMGENWLHLEDASEFLGWLKKENVRIVLHGHNHILGNTEEQGIHIVSCGSSTGNISHADSKKTFITYNLLNITRHSLTCVQCAEEVLGAGINEIKDTDTFTVHY